MNLHVDMSEVGAKNTSILQRRNFQNNYLCSIIWSIFESKTFQYLLVWLTLVIEQEEFWELMQAIHLTGFFTNLVNKRTNLIRLVCSESC